MTRSELIKALAKELNMSLDTVSSIISTILDTMTEALVRGENVELRNFGRFSVREYAAYTGRHPKTGEKTQVKAKKLPFFKVGKELRDAVNAQKQ